MDLGSILTVKTLELKKNDNILDICCAPGAKLMYIADLLYSKDL